MKKVVLISGVLLTFIIGVYVYYYSNSQKYVLKNEYSNQIMSANSLIMMYETDAGSGEYQVSSDSMWPTNGYTFNETLSKCENGSILTWDDENKRVLLQANTSDKCYVYFDIQTFADYIKDVVYTGVDGVNRLYYHDGIGDYTNASEEAGDNSYRYSGSNPNNFVCFGSDEDVCPNDNLYRIIGVFDNQVKLIKYDYVNGFPEVYGLDADINISEVYRDNYKGSLQAYTLFPWYSDYTTTFQFYLNTLDSKWTNLIKESEWYIGGVSEEIVNIANIKTFFDYELGNNQLKVGDEGCLVLSDSWEVSNICTYESLFDIAKIGLIYASGYAYATNPNMWTNNLINNVNISTDNWMYMGLFEFTASRMAVQTFSFDPSRVINIFYSGALSTGDTNDELALRFVFYLNSSVIMDGGTGTQTDPYRIA